jgi:hypothetical protein
LSPAGPVLSPPGPHGRQAGGCLPGPGPGPCRIRVRVHQRPTGLPGCAGFPIDSGGPKGGPGRWRTRKRLLQDRAQLRQPAWPTPSACSAAERPRGNPSPAGRGRGIGQRPKSRPGAHGLPPSRFGCSTGVRVDPPRAPSGVRLLRLAVNKDELDRIVGRVGRATAHDALCRGFDPCPRGVAVDFGPEQSGWLINQLGDPSLKVRSSGWQCAAVKIRGGLGTALQRPAADAVTASVTAAAAYSTTTTHGAAAPHTHGDGGKQGGQS